MIKITICFLSIALFSSLFAQPQPERFGEVYVQVNEEPETFYYAETVVLYRSVSVDYDTTVYIKSPTASEQLYSPQLSKGNNYVVHLILTAADTTARGRFSTYDVFINLGDTLWEQLEILDADSLTFIHPNGILTSDKFFSSHQTGKFDLVASQDGSRIGGNFHTEFDFPIPGMAIDTSHVKMRGQLNIPESSVRTGEETAITGAEKSKKNLTRNIAFAVLLSAFIILFAIR